MTFTVIFGLELGDCSEYHWSQYGMVRKGEGWKKQSNNMERGARQG